MSSVQGKIIDFWFRHQRAFGSEEIDPIAVRARTEKPGPLARACKGVKAVPVNTNGVPAEWLIPDGAMKDCALLYIHGGAWFMGSANTHRALASRIAYASGVQALVINYRLAPENPYPAGLDDCVTAYDWLIQNEMPARHIIVAGDSAGGNLTLALLVALRDQGKPLPAGAIALSPVTDLAFTGESMQTRLHLDPLFFRGGPASMIQGYINQHDPHDPLISPLYADLHGLPPLLIHVGDHEVLLDDARRFSEKATAAGVEVTTVVWPQMFHVFQIFAPILPEANHAIAQLAEFIRSRLKGASEPVNNG
jgi:monoterpene epsilon-lactone hydrolase